MATEVGDEDPVTFFCHLGDIVYLYGETTADAAHFFEPYGLL
jgi:hypothetical protein